MSIPGFGDLSTARLPRLGVIRLGEKKVSAGGKEYPSALDHYRLDDAPSVAEIYGPTPKSLDVMFPVEDDTKFLDIALRAYGRGSGLFCSSKDAEVAVRSRLGLSPGGEHTRVPKGQAFDPGGEAYLKSAGLDGEVDVGERFQMPCAYEECPFYQKKQCKKTFRLLVLLPEVPGVGCFQITSSSANSVRNFRSYLEMIRTAAGRVSMIPLKLNLVPQEAVAEGKKKTIFVLQPVFPGKIKDLIAYRRTPLALPAPHRPEALPTLDEKETPEDLYANGGADLDRLLGQAPPAAPPKPADGGQAAAAARARLGRPAAQAPKSPQAAAQGVQARPSPQKPATAQSASPGAPAKPAAQGLVAPGKRVNCATCLHETGHYEACPEYKAPPPPAKLAEVPPQEEAAGYDPDAEGDGQEPVEQGEQAELILPAKTAQPAKPAPQGARKPAWH